MNVMRLPRATMTVVEIFPNREKSSPVLGLGGADNRCIEFGVAGLGPGLAPHPSDRPHWRNRLRNLGLSIPSEIREED